MVKISALAAGVNTYFLDPGMISRENRRSESKSILSWAIARLEGKKADNADISVVVRKNKLSHIQLVPPSIMTSKPSFQATSLTTLAALADPPIPQIDGAAMDYFLIEAVAALRESAAVATARAKKIEQEMLEAGLIPPPTPVPSSLKKDKDNPAKDSVTSLISKTGSAAGGKSVLDEEEEPVRQRLEAIGMHVGANFSERSVTL